MQALCHIQWDLTGLYDDSISRSKNNSKFTGQMSQMTITLMECLTLGKFRPSNVVLFHLWERVNCIHLWDEFDNLYQNILTQENPANAKHLAKERFLQKILRERTEKGWLPLSLDHARQAVNHILLLGERWTGLVLAVQSAEILLIYQDRGVVDECPNVGDLIESVSDEGFDYLKRQLLDPKNRLRETCLRLTGVRDMIDELANAPLGLELRKYLAMAIKARIESALGPVEEKWPDVPVSRKFLTIVDYLVKARVDILGISITVRINPNNAKKVPEDCEWSKLFQMYKQYAGYEEYTDGDDDVMETDGEEMQPDSGPTPPGAYAGLSPSNFLQFE
ncbi:MAG: hypothetical protein LQ351_004615 [Letrouitia transgressa]|nr:MAG: hypothetical protein LQ351_004615 [Letrouitia transgressa]